MFSKALCKQALLTFGEGQFFIVQNNSVQWKVKSYYSSSSPTTNVNDTPPVTVTTKTPLNDCQDLLGSDISPDENQSGEILPGICPKYICRARRELKKVNLIEFKNLICGPSQVSTHDRSFIQR